MITQKTLDMACLLAQLEYLGFKEQAETLARNNGIQIVSTGEGMTARKLSPELKKALEKELTKPEKNRKPQGRGPKITRVDPDKLTEEEKAEFQNTQRITDHMKRTPEKGMSDLDFMKAKTPRIHYQ